ncbi:hypothetical protein [Hymenobacter sp. YC55]|uniref:hypothetical protein n=1 Tax=Hymenobacter sp. YC55 TaxID=3034019 RepID=UPI0023F7117B|nr:hypothetical protein [Hymenobacter sp. YC55]MDF7815456.1 hypothetical protein [Hymenobacter sp. YC55]
MSAKFSPPDPAEVALLHTFHHLSHPGQQKILADFAAGEIGVETTAYLLIQEAKERFPALKAAREAEAEQRETRAREAREMAENEKANGPTFVDYTPEGRPVNEPAKPLPAGSLVGTVAQPAAVTVGALAAIETAEATETTETHTPDEESTSNDHVEDDANDFPMEDDSTWQVADLDEEQQTYQGDE